MTRTLINIAAVNAGWFACVLGAAAGFHWVGPLAVLALFLLHLGLVRPRRPEILLAVVIAVIGFAVDSLLGMAGAIDPARALLPAPWSTPWMVALWINFGTTLSTSLRWLAGRPLVAALLGAVGGPSAYAAGAGLGAVTLGSPEWLSLVLVGAAWAAAMPAAVAVAARLRAAAGGSRVSA